MSRLLDRSRLLVVALLGIAVSLPAALGVGLQADVASAAPGDKPAYEQTKTLTRTLKVAGETFTADSRDVTVTVDRTTELRGRERVNISWSGAHPSGGRAANPFGELGLNQEYPVVVLQCRGVDDASLPVDQQLAPETCWTSTRQQRTQSLSDSQAVWRRDALATEEQRAQKAGLLPVPAECGDVEPFSTRLTPFRAANGTVYAACTSETMPPEAAVGAAFPPAEMAAFTDLEGNGHVKFEVRSSIENESLGCSDKVACSIVVIPIEGISCIDEDPECNKAGRFESGASNFANEGVDMSVSPLLWWSPSNWNNRFSVPISFGLPPDACSILDDRAPTGFYGSELMAQASLQWSPAYCLNKKRFKFQHNKMSDAAGFALAENGGGAAAFVSSEHETRGADPVAYAPTAVTGFSVAYAIDQPDNRGEYTRLKLNARLLAKLITQSYIASERGRGHPGLGTNPVSLNLDPEFQKLNPGLDTIGREAAATVLSLSESSDVIETLTSYIANDEDAMAFVAGKADPWGMKVNPSYKKIKLPTAEWPLLDDYVPPTNDECYLQNPAPYFTQIAAPVNSLRKIAEAVLDAWPNVQTRCERSTVTDPWKLGRVERQGVGSRFMLGIVSIGDARRLDLTEASLETRGKTYVGPSDASMAKAIRLAEPSRSGDEPFALDMAKVVKARAYPGTMIVYTAARTANLPQEDADKVAEFITVATSEGQKAGFGNGELPEGYLPIKRTGVTAALWKQAQAVATEVKEQKGVTRGEGDGSGDGSGTGPGSGDTGGSGGTDPGPGSVTEVGDDEPQDEPADTGDGTGPGKGDKGDEGDQADGTDGEQELVAMPPTTEVSSPVAERMLPLLLLVALVSAVAANLVRLRDLRRRRS